MKVTFVSVPQMLNGNVYYQADAVIDLSVEDLYFLRQADKEVFASAMSALKHTFSEIAKQVQVS